MVQLSDIDIKCRIFREMRRNWFTQISARLASTGHELKFKSSTLGMRSITTAYSSGSQTWACIRITRGFSKMQIAGPYLQSLQFVRSGRVDKILFLTCFQLMLVLLVSGPHLWNNLSRLKARGPQNFIRSATSSKLRMAWLQFNFLARKFADVSSAVWRLVSLSYYEPGQPACKWLWSKCVGLGFAESCSMNGSFSDFLALPRLIAVFKMIQDDDPTPAQVFVVFMYRVFPKGVIKLNPLIITSEVGLYYILPCWKPHNHKCHWYFLLYISEPIAFSFCICMTSKIKHLLEETCISLTLLVDTDRSLGVSLHNVTLNFWIFRAYLLPNVLPKLYSSKLFCLLVLEALGDATLLLLVLIKPFHV